MIECKYCDNEIDPKYGLDICAECDGEDSRPAPCSRCVELESIVREMVAHCEGGRVGTIGAYRVYTRQINVKAVERWKQILNENGGDHQQGAEE